MARNAHRPVLTYLHRRYNRFPPSKAPSSTWLEPRDRCHLVRAAEMFLGMSVSWRADELPFDTGSMKFDTIDIDVAYAWDTGRMRITRLSTGDFNFLAQNNKENEDYQQWLRGLVHWIAQRAFCLVPADRVPRAEELEGEKRTAKGSDISDLLARGRLKEAFFRAGNHPDAVIRHRYKQLQTLLTGPPLDRPPFAVTHDPASRKLEIVEEGGDSPYRVSEVPLDLAGLGIAQIYSILAQIILPGMRAVGIEEPEAHLHAPTTGRDLRQILERVVKEHYIDQLFIATHSNLFDLDPSGYHEVTMDHSEGTRVAWKALSQVDEHLYEPGPGYTESLRPRCNRV